ncbi:unnamed protein product [Rotaria sordida]|uniref:G-protein coupled receptors family 1 profile domain-containing protein n=1 Tax=Rotaria sordida TaxID=392033 RepID=A0A818UND5_9BILA|nr:unnamed protein product [Rotaria sordida]CAF3700754.1 unnamed protein product [Rotaria sordida]
MMLQDLKTDHNYSYQPNLFWMKNIQTHTSFLFSFILFFIYAIIFLIGLIANIFVIVMIIKRRRMRTLTNRFLLNLAISDLIATLVCLPPTAYHYYDKRWIFGEFLCRFVPFMQGTSVAVSIFTLMAVSIDRFIAIHKPIHSKILCTPTRIIVTIVMTWIASLLLMIPLILHHRIVDPFEITLTACAEEWHQNMNARLVYDFILLIVLFILPLTLMTYCYIRISFSLWFIDSNIQTTSSTSTINTGRFSILSDDFQNDIRLNSAQNTRSLCVHYHKTNENNLNRQQLDDYRSLLMPNRQRQQNTILNNNNNTYNHSLNIISRRFSDNNYKSNTNCLQLNKQQRSTSIGQRYSISQYTTGIFRSSVISLQNQNRISNANNPQRRSIFDFEHASRILQSRRRVVKLLITLVIVFFITRLPLNILSIYIDVTSNTYLPDNTYTNITKFGFNEDQVAVYSSYVTNTDKKMFLVLYVNPIFQLFSLSNSAINPLCYCVMSHAVKHIFIRFREKIRRGGNKKASSLTLVQ